VPFRDHPKKACVGFSEEGEMIDLWKGLQDKGDPLADAALIDYLNATAAQRELLKQGMSQGTAAVSTIPERFRALLLDSEAAVSSMSTHEIDQAMEPYLWLGPMWTSIALGPGSLAHTYADPAIAAVLMRTGNLVGSAVSRRLLETQAWTIGVLKPGGLCVGGSGYVQTIQVRLLHARVRARLIEQGWRDSNGGPSIPMNQLQMLRTWLDFTVVPFNAFGCLGLTLTDAQTLNLYRVWRLLGRLLGIDPSLLSTITDNAAAQALLTLIDGQLSPPDENSRVLTGAMLEAIGNRLAPALGMPAPVSILLMFSLCQLFHGDQMAEQLGLQPNWTAALLPMMIDANQFRLMRLAQDPDHRAMVCQKSLETFEAIEAGRTDLTAYQTLSTGAFVGQ
jgi:hypothetical protein